MEKLQIEYGVQGDGMTFGLRSSDQRVLEKMFPDAQPPESIFVIYDWRVDFVNYHANLEKYIFPALMGLKNDEDLKKIKKIEFVKMPENKVTYTIEQNEQNDQEIQPIPRKSGAVLHYVWIFIDDFSAFVKISHWFSPPQYNRKNAL